MFCKSKEKSDKEVLSVWPPILRSLNSLQAWTNYQLLYNLICNVTIFSHVLIGAHRLTEIVIPVERPNFLLEIFTLDTNTANQTSNFWINLSFIVCGKRSQKQHILGMRKRREVPCERQFFFGLFLSIINKIKWFFSVLQIPHMSQKCASYETKLK